MNKRWILLFVLILLAALAWILHRRSTGTTLSGPLSNFAIEDTARVDRIFITDQRGVSIDLRRTPDGWKVNEHFNANQHNVDLLLRAFKRIEVRSPVPKSTEPTVLRTMSAGARRVEIYQGDDEPEKIWIVGHGTQDHFGTYMLLEIPGEGRSNVPFITGMTGFTGIMGPRFHTNLDDWRSHELFAVDDLHDIAAVEVEHPQAPAASYRIEQKEDGSIRFTDLHGAPLPFDTVLVKGALLPYKELNYEYIERGSKSHQRDSLLGSSPNHIVRLHWRNDGNDEMKFWYRKAEGATDQWEPQELHDKLRMYALVQDTLLVVVQREMFDRIVQPASALRP